jgi:hypothetical protein
MVTYSRGSQKYIKDYKQGEKNMGKKKVNIEGRKPVFKSVHGGKVIVGSNIVKCKECKAPMVYWEKAYRLYDSMGHIIPAESFIEETCMICSNKACAFSIQAINLPHIEED